MVGATAVKREAETVVCVEMVRKGARWEEGLEAKMAEEMEVSAAETRAEV